MSKIFNNPFKRREREQERLKKEAAERERSRVPTTQPLAPRQGAIPRRQLSPAECLNAINALLEQIRGLNPNAIHAFPLLNQSQRLVQELREAVHLCVPPAEKNVWLFQIQELQEEVQSQTERIVSSAASRPGPSPTVRTAASTLAGGSGAANAAQRQNSSGRSTLPSSTPYLSTPSRPQLQRPSKNLVPPSHVALQSALFPSQASPATAAAGAAAGAAAPNPHGFLQRTLAADADKPAGTRSTPSSSFASPSLASASIGRAIQSPEQHPSASSAAKEDDMFSGLSITEPSSNLPSPSRQQPSAQPLGAMMSEPPSAPASAARNASLWDEPASAHRRGSSWSADLLAAASRGGPAPGPDSAYSGGLDAVDPTAKKSGMKKKTRGVKVGYGTREDPHAPSTPASPGSFTAAGPGSFTSVPRPSPLMSRQSSSMSASATAATSTATAAEPRPGLEQRPSAPQPQPVLAQRPVMNGVQQAAVEAAAAQRLNLPSGSGYGRPAAVSAARTSDPSYAPRPASVPPHAPAPAQAAAADGEQGSLISWGSLSRSSMGAPGMQHAGLGTHGPAPLHAQPMQGPGLPAALPASAGTLPQQLSSPSPGILSPRPSSGLAPFHARVAPQQLPSASQPPSSSFHVSASSPASATAPPGSAAARVEMYLCSLSGPLESCHEAATAAAAEVAQQLAAAAATLEQQEAATRQAQQARLADLATCSEATAVLERQQQEAVDRDDYDAAAALDERLQQVAAQAGAVEAAARQLEAAAAQVRARRVEMQEQQAQVWDVAAVYLQRLHDEQSAAAAAAAAALERELGAAAAQHAQAERAIAEAEAALGARRAELAVSRREVEARALGATWQLTGEKDRLTKQEASLEALIQRLREELALRERQLAETSAQLAQVQGQIVALTAPFAPELGALSASEAQLQAQGEGLQQQVRVVQQYRAQAEQRRTASEQQQQQLAQQGQALVAAAAAMTARAAEARRLAADDERAGASRAQAQALSAEEATAKDSLLRLSKCVQDLGAEVEALGSRAAALEAECTEAQGQAAQLSRTLPDLEAAKKAAAGRKDFKEAARLSSESKAAQAQLDSLTQRAAQAQAALQAVQVQRTSKAAELQELKAMLPELEGEVATARHKSLVQQIEQKQLHLNRAAAEERYEEAQQLQFDLNAAVAEAAGLAETWGLSRSGDEQQQQQQQQQVGSQSAERHDEGAGTGAANGGVTALKAGPGLSLLGAASSCSSSMDTRTVVMHDTLEGRDSDGPEPEEVHMSRGAGAGAGQATSASPEARGHLGAPVPGHPSDAGKAGDLTHLTTPGGAEAGQKHRTASPAVPAAAQSTWRPNDLFDGEGVAAAGAGLHQAAGSQTVDADGLPTRATAEQLLHQAGLATLT